MKSKDVAIMIYGDIDSKRDALTEEKYKDLAEHFSLYGFNVTSVLYHDDLAQKLANNLLKFHAILVWVNPIEQGNDRNKLDALLKEISEKGCFVSTHPEIIIKMGTKKILYDTRNMEWGCDTKMYRSFDDFEKRFPDSLKEHNIRVLKQYRGNGGNGVYKIIYHTADSVKIIHAITGSQERILSWNEFNSEFKSFFSNDGLLIDQEWNKNTINGMVRCYVVGTKVAGFGYQEINAFYELNNNNKEIYSPPSKRYYFTENCGLFNDLKQIMEGRWIPQLQKELSIAKDMMPVIWDADFFINIKDNSDSIGKYTLCEINVSCVSPFPPSAIKFIVDEVRRRIN